MITLLSATCHFSAWFFAQHKSWMFMMLASWKDTKSYRRKVLFPILFDLFGCFPYLYYTILERREDVFTLTFVGEARDHHDHPSRWEPTPWTFSTRKMSKQSLLTLDIGWCFFGELEVMPCKWIGDFERFHIWLYMIVDSYICWSCMLFPIHRKRPRYKLSFELWGS